MTTYQLPPICILGLGLIGGSLMRDLHARGERVYGFTLHGARAARRDGFDVSDSMEEVLRRAESDGALIVVAVPMGAVASVLDQVASFAPTCDITDVVSVKKPVYDLIVERDMQARYVGGHPMAGTEFSGWNASHEGLFSSAAWAVTYDYAREGLADQHWAALFGTVCKLASVVGAEAVPVRVALHDEAVARVSHLPHVIAEALSLVGDRGGTLAQSLSAGSFRGATRVASTEPELVRNMCETNAKSLVPVLDEFIGLLQDARDSLDDDPASLSHLTEAGHRAHLRMAARKGARRESVSPVKISSRPVMRIHPGAPGWVRQLEQVESLGGRVEVF